MSHKPSPYQQAIFDFVSSGKGNGIVVARAGSGKTTTLVEVANRLPKRADAVFLAFNKSIATELGERLPSHVASSTFHSLCFKAIGPTLKQKNNGTWAKVDANKVGYIFDNAYRSTPLKNARAATLKLVSLMKNHALAADTSQESIEALISHFDIECEDEAIHQEDIINAARFCLTESNKDTSRVDFDDMLYLVIVLDVRMPTFDYVMCDEVQDFNDIQRLVLHRLLRRPGARLLAVGDPAQAIYGFRGAASNSMELISTEFQCTTLPLSISYRCPSSVIELAQKFVPDIMPRDNAPKGTVRYPNEFPLQSFSQTDLLLCRNTAPLVQTAYKMIAQRIPCKIMGRDIGRGLIALIKKLAGKNFERMSLESLLGLIERYQTEEVQRAMAKRQEVKAQSINDKAESLIALIDSMTPDDYKRGVPGLIAIIDSMFADNGAKCTTLATVHKAKGMESPRVFILDAHLMPSKYARQEWQQVQEANLRYVAITRSLDTLVYLQTENIV